MSHIESQKRATEARNRFRAGETPTQLSKAYGVEITTVYRWIGGIKKKYGSGAQY